MPVKPSADDVQRNMLFSRVAVLKKNCGILSDKAFRMKKALFLTDKTGLLHKVNVNTTVSFIRVAVVQYDCKFHKSCCSSIRL